MTRAVRFSRFAWRFLAFEGREGCGANIPASVVASAKGVRFFVLSIRINNLCKYMSLWAASLWLCARRVPLRA
ncbi:hypothetical protein [Acidomonas methanolica]|uniref:hypothetical protein n=1 Tax=Acidomonas methanolica TaxID=437 RepID=UPI002119C27A|nr:hypothetical protein [Acidomonas methanolica]MCQ9154919.1 hypothetical protein [Acidomonas methanolica]